jgi:hypothetical protein
MSGRRFAYADPPYLGSAQRYYGKLHSDAARFDRIEAHVELIADLEERFPDGWALSCNAPSLMQLARICPDGVRVAAWCKPFSGVRPGIRARFGWEPVLYRTRLCWDHGPQFTDFLIENGNRAKRGQDLFPGRKPVRFAQWVAEILGWVPGDTIEDLFPGSGAVTREFLKLRHPEFQLQLEAA